MYVSRKMFILVMCKEATKQQTNPVGAKLKKNLFCGLRKIRHDLKARFSYLFPVQSHTILGTARTGDRGSSVYASHTIKHQLNCL